MDEHLASDLYTGTGDVVVAQADDLSAASAGLQEQAPDDVKPVVDGK